MTPSVRSWRGLLRGLWAALTRRPRRVQTASLLAAVLLVLPSVRSGFFADDYFQIAQLEGCLANQAGPFDLYSFVPRDAAVAARLRQDGALPYFTAPRLQIAFLRPLSSALMWLDHALFGRRAIFYHLHTLLWYAAFLATAAALLRRLPSASLATLGLVVFCLDGGHAMAASWVAARNATVSCTLVFLAFIAHRRWREDGWRPGAVLAPMAAALGLAGGEMALAALCYPLAWELVERRPSRARGLAWLLALMAVYLIVYRVTGSGAHASGAYLDPVGDPAGFVRALPGRVLLLAGSLLVAAPIDLVATTERLRLPLMGLGAMVVVVLAFWLPRALRRMAPGEARAVRGFALGAAGALLVGTPALPGDRVLLAASLGGSVVVAALLRDAWRSVVAGRARGPALLGLLFFGVPKVALAPFALVGKVIVLRDLFQDSRRLAREAEISAPVPAHVVVLAMNDLLPIHLSLLRIFEHGLPPDEIRPITAARARGGAGLPLPDWLGYRGTTVLSLSEAALRLRRTAADSFELSTPNGTLFDGIWPEVMRATSLPLPSGSVIRLAEMTAIVRDDRDGRPTRVEFLFDRPLEDPSLIFLALVDDRLRRFPLPPVGGEVSVPQLRPLHLGPEP